MALHTPAALADTATAVAVVGTHIHNNLTCAVCAQQARTRFCRKCGPSVPLHGPKMKQGPPEVLCHVRHCVHMWIEQLREQALAKLLQHGRTRA